MIDAAKIYGINASVFLAVSLADISLVLQILLLAATLCWTIFKGIAAWRALKKNKN
jgi:hypothetical protein